MSEIFKTLTFPAVFGATGSLGRCVCRILAQECMPCAHLGGWRAHDTLAELLHELRPLTVSFDGEPSATLANAMSRHGVARALDIDGALEHAAGAVVVSSGLDGFSPMREAIVRGMPVATGNKEAIVAYGRYLLSPSCTRGARPDLRPVDSEHAAAAVLLRHLPADHPVDRLILTGTGGAVRDVPWNLRHDLSPSEVLRHPVWKMGAKITVDSATLVNKALEIVEAAILFGIPSDRITVMFDPGASIHAAVEAGGDCLAYRAPAEMAGPVRIALGLPEVDGASVISGSAAGAAIGKLVAPDPASCRAIDLGHTVLATGGCTPMVLAMADEAGVRSFLAGRMKFGEIVPFIEDTLEKFRHAAAMDPESPGDLQRLRKELESFTAAV